VDMPLQRPLAIVAALAILGGGVMLASHGLAGGSRPVATAEVIAVAAVGQSGDSEPTADPAAATITSPVSNEPAVGSAASPMSDHLAGDVYGYLPYWEMDSTIEASLDWNALSAIALFSVTQNKDGSLNTAAPGYVKIVSAQGRQIIATAKSRGVRTEIVFTSFGKDSKDPKDKNVAFFTNPTAQAATIAALRALVQNVGAQGVDVDVEILSGTYFPAYASFCASLRAALRLDNPTATVTVATNANTSGANMAKAALALGIDRAFMMGYAYRSAGSTPGAIAPIDFRSDPLKLDLKASLDLYATTGVPLGRVILGLPLYGMTWPTKGPLLGDARTPGGSGTSYIPESHLAQLAANAAGIALEPIESVAWFAWKDPATATWRQTFYDTPASLQPKFQLALDRDLAGIGFWALGYERGLPGYWDKVKEMFGPPRLVALSAPARTRSLNVPIAVAVVPGSRPLASVQLSSDGRTWSDPVALPALPDGAAPDALRPGLAWVIPGTRDGTYRLSIRAVDDTGTLSRPRAASVILDRTGPRLSPAPVVWWSPTAHAWRVRWTAATDAAGIAGYRVRVRVGTGAWRVVTSLTTARSATLKGIRRTATVRVAVTPQDRLGNWGASGYGRSRH
jgi:spore germination protein YaaH